MSFVGENYWHSDSAVDIRWLHAVLTQALEQDQSVRLFTNSGGLQVARGSGCWSGTLYSTPDNKRDTTTQPIYVRS